MRHTGTLRRRLDPRREDGIALVLVLAVIVLFSITTVTAVSMSTSTQTTSSRSSTAQTAAALAEAGVNTAESVLNANNTNASSPTLLGCSVSGVNANNSATPCTDLTVSTSFGTASFHGLFAQGAGNTGTWTITATGSMPTPNGGGSAVTRSSTATVTITGGGQSNNISVWNYLYSTAPQGAGCEFSLGADNSNIQVPIYVTGDVCLLGQTSQIIQDTAHGGQPVDLRVGGTLSIMGGSSTVGTAGSPLTSGYIAGGCIRPSALTPHPCTTADKYYVTSADAPLVATPPVTDFPGWYQNASPGPKHICDPALTPAPNLTGASNKFDNDVTMNGTNPAFNLTPTGNDYNCVTANGTLSWNHTTHLLTINGTIFFDGNVTMQDGLARYHGKATLYVNGEIYFNQGGSGTQASILAGCPASPAAATSQCAFNTSPGWDPNMDMLMLVSNKNSGTSIDMSSDHTLFQGSMLCPPGGTLLASGDTTTVEGGVICGKFSLTQDHYHFYPLPTITNLPPGAPLPPNAPASITPPQYTG